MRISFILSSLALTGGNLAIVEFANRLSARQHAVTLVAPHGTLDPLVTCEIKPEVVVQQSRVAMAGGAPVVHWPALSLSMAMAVPASDIIVSTHTPTTVPGGIASILLRRGRLAWYFQDYALMFRGRRVERWLMYNAYRWHARILTPSVHCQSEQPAAAQHKTQLVGEGLAGYEHYWPVPIEARPASSLRATRRARLDPEYHVLHVGDSRLRKGTGDFLQAISRVLATGVRLRVTLVSKEQLTLEVPFPLDFVHRPTRAQLADLYRSCDLFVSASWGEGLGYPPLEAMACALPVILTDSGGVREYAEDGINCLLVPPRNPEAMAAAIGRLAMDRGLARQLSSNGPRTAARYDWSESTLRFETALNEVLGQR